MGNDGNAARMRERRAKEKEAKAKEAAKKEESLEDRLDRILDKVLDSVFGDDMLDEEFSDEELKQLGSRLADDILATGVSEIDLRGIRGQIEEATKIYDSVRRAMIKEFGEPPSLDKFINKDRKLLPRFPGDPAYYDAVQRNQEWTQRFNSRLKERGISDSVFGFHMKNGTFISVRPDSGERLPRGFRYSNVVFAESNYGDNTANSQKLSGRWEALKHPTSNEAFSRRLEQRLKLSTRRK